MVSDILNDLSSIFIFEENQSSLFDRIIFFQRTIDQTGTIRFLDQNPEKVIEDYIQARNELLENVEPPVLTILNLDTLEVQYGVETLNSMLSQFIGSISIEEICLNSNVTLMITDYSWMITDK